MLGRLLLVQAVQPNLLLAESPQGDLTSVLPLACSPQGDWSGSLTAAADLASFSASPRSIPLPSGFHQMFGFSVGLPIRTQANLSLCRTAPVSRLLIGTLLWTVPPEMGSSTVIASSGLGRLWCRWLRLWSAAQLQDNLL